ncbi:MAG: toll/interleukin-1 receptor domain-containing protein [Vicinamibacterales bacterium]
MAGVFISYRREDSQGFAGRLADDLSEHLGNERVFRDLEIPIGSNFADVLTTAVASCDALLVVIGHRWAGQTPGGLGFRLFEPDDWVRAEIETALARRRPVIPVLVAGARMPSATDLPASIAPLATVQAAQLSDRHWDADLTSLLVRLRQLCPALRHAPTVPSPVAHGDSTGRRRETPARSSRPSFLARLARASTRAVWKRVRAWFSLAFSVGVLYVGIRLFGDDAWQRGLDAIEARLLLGWNRLLGWLAGLG